MNSLPRFAAFWLIPLALLGGCGTRLPRTTALHGPELEQALARLDRYLDRSCARSVDSDVDLGWQAYGRREVYPGTLQALAPARLRLALVDPLGRPQLLLVSNGSRFTLADNRRVEGFTGPVDSGYITKYLPPEVVGEELFSWLSGRVERSDSDEVGVEEGQEGRIWYSMARGELSQYLVLDQDRLRRRLLKDADGNILLDVHYSDYLPTEDGCLWPGRLEITGEHLPAGFTLDFTRIYSLDPPGDRVFELQLPQHFSVQEVR